MNTNRIYLIEYRIAWNGNLSDEDYGEVSVIAKSLDEALGKGTRLAEEFIEKDLEIQHKILYDAEPPKVFVVNGRSIDLYFNEDRENFEIEIRKREDHKTR